MALIIALGYSSKYMLANMDDAKAMLEIMNRATPVEDVNHRYRDELREKFGSDYFVDTAGTSEVEVKLTHSEPVPEKEYQELLKRLKSENQPKAA